MDLIERMVRSSGRSWWEVLLLGGRTLAEWKTARAARLPLLPLRQLQERTRWEELDHDRIVAVRLLCPNGQVAEVQAARPRSLFQFKVGRAMAGPGGSQRVLDAHVVGVVLTEDGHCDCWAWDYGQQALLRLADSVRDFRYQGLGALNLVALGVSL